MPKTVSTPVKDLQIDLQNYRTIAQPNDIQAIQAMISNDPDWFWALMESLLDDGYLPTENIIVLESGSKQIDFIVKEGNRRIAALKLIHGYLPIDDISVPDELTAKLATLPTSWKRENENVPCTIYPAKDVAKVDRIVTLTHGKGEKAGRARWNAVARARHNRNFKKAPEHGLDLLEKYLQHGQNLNKSQVRRWAGDFNLSVLDEAVGKLAPLLGIGSGPELVRNYPKIASKDALDDIIRDIGVGIFTFSTLRSGKDFLTPYLPQANSQSTNSTTSGNSTSSPASTNPSTGVNQHQGNTATSTANSGNGSGSSSASGTGAGAGNTSGVQSSGGKKMAAVPMGDPRAVKRALKKFVPLGNNRQKVVTLRNEAAKLKLADNPIAFCFLLRSMFEISAKAYCADHQATGGPSSKKANGDDKSLSALLTDIHSHLTKNNSDKAMLKLLHGAITELARADGLLSVTSMNQLVHNPTFSISPSDIATLFSNIFPLLEIMNS